MSSIYGMGNVQRLCDAALERVMNKKDLAWWDNQPLNTVPFEVIWNTFSNSNEHLHWEGY